MTTPNEMTEWQFGGGVSRYFLGWSPVLGGVFTEIDTKWPKFVTFRKWRFWQCRPPPLKVTHFDIRFHGVRLMLIWPPTKLMILTSVSDMIYPQQVVGPRSNHVCQVSTTNWCYMTTVIGLMLIIISFMTHISLHGISFPLSRQPLDWIVEESIEDSCSRWFGSLGRLGVLGMNYYYYIHMIMMSPRPAYNNPYSHNSLKPKDYQQRS
jgi:hypothetical protein